LKTWIRIRIHLKSWIRIRIHLKSWIRVRIHLKSWILIRIKSMRIRIIGTVTLQQPAALPVVLWTPVRQAGFWPTFKDKGAA
jgi:hypothetical protein